jgi:hypothetical protein
MPFVRAHHGVSLLLESVPKSSALRYKDREAHWQADQSGGPQRQRAFIWQLSPDDWDDVAERISVLPGGGGHQYRPILWVWWMTLVWWWHAASTMTAGAGGRKVGDQVPRSRPERVLDSRKNRHEIMKKRKQETWPDTSTCRHE